MEGKAVWKSKTLWVNLLAVVALVVQSYTGFVISAESQVIVLGLINAGLRVVTKQPVNWDLPGKGSSAAVVLLLAASLMTGCASTPAAGTSADNDSPQILAGKSLLAVKSTIVTAATAVDSLCAAGQIPADTCSQAKAAYDQAKPAYDAAVDAYLLMTSQGGDPAAFGQALTRVQSIANNMLLLAGGTKQ